MTNPVVHGDEQTPPTRPQDTRDALRTVYVAGPMAGYPDLNRPAFREAAKRLADSGVHVVNPHDVDPDGHEGDCPRSYATNPDGHAAACYLRPALRALLGCDEIHLLPGWGASVGARLELQVAAAVGMRVSFAGSVSGGGNADR